MHSPTTVGVLSAEEAATFAPEQVVNLSRQLAAAQHQLELFRQQLDWFKRQLFGQKSERRVLDADSVQLNLGEIIG